MSGAPATGEERAAAGGPTTVVVELYGTARLRAGRDEVSVSLDGDARLGPALAALEAACPELAGEVMADGRLSPHFRVALNGRTFASDPEQPLSPGDRLVLLSAAVGG